METVDCVVIGAGVVGLAVARALALAGREVLVLEAAEGIGTETSSRNCEVIHAGIYYPKGSLRRAPASTAAAALRLLRRARRAAPRLRQADRRDAARRDRELLQSIKGRPRPTASTTCACSSGTRRPGMEPELRCVAALLSPSTGIIDSHAPDAGLSGRRRGARRRCSRCTAPVIGGRVATERHRARGRRRRADDALAAACWSTAPASTRRARARRIAGFRRGKSRPTYYAKGNYFPSPAAPPSRA